VKGAEITVGMVPPAINAFQVAAAHSVSSGSTVTLV